MMHKRYLLWLLLLCCLTLLPAIVLNWILLTNEGSVVSMSFAASNWQQRTHGITYTPTMGSNTLFKTLRLNDRLPDINTVILGSSTGMPVDSAMMPHEWRLYNFTQSGSSLGASIAQAEYLVSHVPQIKHYIIAIDWALDFPYQTDPILPVDLARPTESLMAAQEPHPSFLSMLRETMSYPRMTKLRQALTAIAKSPYPLKTFHEYFLQLGSDEYACPDGQSVGKDFGIYNRGACNGFRYDGSATFSDYPRVDDVNRLIIDALVLDSKYAHALLHTRGALNPERFDRLTALDQAITRNGGTLMLYMPPLVPGLERALLEQPQLSAALQRTKREFLAWAKNTPVMTADFGQSEKFGCVPGEFLDEHHATQSCYRKIFTVFWKQVGLPYDSPPFQRHGN
ncbi:MAG: hypothetical protein GC139_07920 [Sideroxydans sp.]|nr:hypothetical protein [Sideroxydans sp.]